MLQVRVGLVGLDMVLLVMGQELVSFKIVDAALITQIAASAPEATPPGSPTAHGLPPAAVTVALTVEDMSMRDMQVSAVCLRPCVSSSCMTKRVWLPQLNNLSYSIVSPEACRYSPNRRRGRSTAWCCGRGARVTAAASRWSTRSRLRGSSRPPWSSRWPTRACSCSSGACALPEMA